MAQVVVRVAHRIRSSTTTGHRRILAGYRSPATITGMAIAVCGMVAFRLHRPIGVPSGFRIDGSTGTKAGYSWKDTGGDPTRLRQIKKAGHDAPLFVALLDFDYVRCFGCCGFGLLHQLLRDIKKCRGLRALGAG